MRPLIATYLERDVRSPANAGCLPDVERFLRACALRWANLLNKADRARDVGTAPSTANHWLSALEAPGQVVLLEPWFPNRTRSIVEDPRRGEVPWGVGLTRASVVFTVVAVALGLVGIAPAAAQAPPEVVLCILCASSVVAPRVLRRHAVSARLGKARKSPQEPVRAHLLFASGAGEGNLIGVQISASAPRFRFALSRAFASEG